MPEYRLLDCGNQKKLEQIGDYKIIRPCPQALWEPLNPQDWEVDIDSEFTREEGEKGIWKARKNPEGLKRNKLGSGLPESWIVQSPDGLEWLVQPNEFGNIGIFTEHWTYAPALSDWFRKPGPILNVFTYSGSNCVSLVRDGFRVTAVDSSKNAMDTYVYNLGQNNLSREGQRLILEDAFKFMSREVRRGNTYPGVMIDAPSFGRGTKGEVFKIEDDLIELLKTAQSLLSPDGKLVLTLHSPRFTPMILQIIIQQLFKEKKVTVEEILQHCESGVDLPSGLLVKVG
jgi:23S rRNA (cytosine1962-C5)-methyltransferase